MLYECLPICIKNPNGWACSMLRRSFKPTDMSAPGQHARGSHTADDVDISDEHRAAPLPHEGVGFDGREGHHHNRLEYSTYPRHIRSGRRGYVNDAAHLRVRGVCCCVCDRVYIKAHALNECSAHVRESPSLYFFRCLYTPPWVWIHLY